MLLARSVSDLGGITPCKKLATLVRHGMEALEDEADPTQFYERAAALRPDEYGADGSRIRRVEPNTHEREERLDREGRERREAFLQGMKDGTRTVNYAESATPKPRKLKKPR